MNSATKKIILGWIPYVIGAILVVQFFALSVWQISRGLEKKAEQDAFESQAGFSAWSDGMELNVRGSWAIVRSRARSASHQASTSAWDATKKPR